MNKRVIIIKILAAAGYIGMIFVNYLANALPINGVTTGEASDAYTNLFTPSGITFSIWGLIYLLLGGYTLYQFGIFQESPIPKREKLFNKIGSLFIVTSLANSSWIFAWHYDLIALSVFIMLLLLVYLIKIANIVKNTKLSKKDNLLIRLPFSIYFGWITIATIANITVFLVSIGWNGLGINDQIWTIVILLVGAAIVILRGLKDKNIAYISVAVWAYFGIWLRQTAQEGFANQYSGIIRTAIFSMILFLISIAFISKNKLHKERSTT
ncbi:tryptophan-rich sensory protein [Candidatus Woesebacteria bacterium]|nr:tryptophan-rich sensory protein [Candidatus Woesebacteria bacterium]